MKIENVQASHYSFFQPSIAGLFLSAMISGSLAVGEVSGKPPETLPSGVSRVGPAELKMDRKTITAGWLEHPIPQGMVDENPPWLHVSVPLYDGKEETNSERKSKVASQKWNRRFYFKLSRDSKFEKEVLESGPKRWSFYSPYRRLQPGTYFWTYGIAPAETPGTPKWSDKIFSFQITGKEHAAAIPPTPEDFVAAIKKWPRGPLVTVNPEDIGKLLPEKKDPALSKEILSTIEKDFALLKTPSVAPAKKQLHSGMPGEKLTLQERQKQSQEATVAGRAFNSLLVGYVLTGEKKYKDTALDLLGKKTKPVGKDEKLFSYQRVSSGGKPLLNEQHLVMLDLFYDDLTADERFRLIQSIYCVICSHYNSSPDVHEYLEHALYDNHAWQSALPALLRGSVALCRINSEFDEWVKYAYELYLYRAPAFSRTDGGSSEGNGYLGVHEQALVTIPWLVYRLTNYNVYTNKQWFLNISKNQLYSNPVGNPSISFEDAGDDGGAKMTYFAEALAYLSPENSANVLLHKSIGRRPNVYFAADLKKGPKPLDLLSIWHHLPAPDLCRSLFPLGKAAASKDVGLVSMHTDLSAATNNLMLNFRAGPYGSEGHTHPAQNAFTLSYGGQELFWRTGYYNGGGLHNIFSYKCSRSHNTILADGLVQGFDQGAYAWIARFATGDRISYALGDASHAYNAKHHNFDIPYNPNLNSGKVAMRRNWKMAIPEHGFGDPGVTRFRRHLVMLRPSHVLIYDDLEAKKPITWTFQLHSRREMQQMGDAWFKTANDFGLGTARLFCATPVKGELTDKFKGTPVDEENKRKGQNPPNWHVNITTCDRLPATRFLTVLEIYPKKGLSATPMEPVAKDSGGQIQIQVGDYSVHAELDPAKASFLEVKDNAGTCGLVTGQGATSLTLGSAQKQTSLPGSTLLWERKTPRGEIVVDEQDELPDSLLYGNVY